MRLPTTALLLLGAHLALSAPTTLNPCGKFALELTNTDLINGYSPLNNTWATLGAPSGPDVNNSAIEYEIAFTGSPLALAAAFSLDPDGHLYTQTASLIASTDPDADFGLLHFDRFPGSETGQVPAVCSVAQDRTLTCETGPGVGVWQLCLEGDAPGDLYLGTEVQSGCVGVTPLAWCV